MNPNTVHPVDEILPAPRLVALGLHHVMVRMPRLSRRLRCRCCFP